ncbi:MAG: metallophosphoesterase [Planctomycetota bacterium]
MRRALGQPDWKRSHRLRWGVWQTFNRLGLTGLHGLPHHPAWVDVERIDMPIPGLPDALVGRRLVQISDLHHSPVVGRSYLRQHIERVNRLRPWRVVVTGDLVTGGYRFDRRVAALLARIDAPTICTFGNHDYSIRGKRNAIAAGRRGKHLRLALESEGLTVLQNEALVIDGLTLVGLDDLWTGRLDADIAFAGVAGPCVCLNHDPRNARDLLAHPWQWMLAGHTHGRPLRKSIRPFTAGHYPLANGKDLYVNRGLSYGMRSKQWCKPEITVFRLVDADRSPTAT